MDEYAKIILKIDGKNIDENLKEQILKEIINETLEEEKEHIQEETFNKASISL